MIRGGHTGGREKKERNKQEVMQRQKQEEKK